MWSILEARSHLRIRRRTHVRAHGRCFRTSRATGSNVEGVDEMTCPKCGSTMETRTLGNAEVSRCTSCNGIFLERADLGNLIEAENDWHAGAGVYHTEPLPRITADMTAPPPSKPRARSFIETLFG